jgi:hypothetical protein
MQQPRQWTADELSADATAAAAAFRRQRLDEPLELYSRFFEAFCPVFRSLVERLPALRAGEGLLSQLLAEDDGRTAFRYLGAPPISEDDLKTLAESRLSPAKLCRDADEARRVRETVLHIIDPHRFPWVREDRSPVGDEVERAVIASAALVATKKVETSRRTNAKKTQEEAVKQVLANSGFSEVARRDIALLDDAPPVGSFCRECKLGNTRADMVLRLKDRRVMAIECKVSNSAVNSYKRVNHEAAGKAQQWLEAFGARAIVPAAVLGGVFKPANLATAQDVGLALYWQQRLTDLEAFLRSAAG